MDSDPEKQRDGFGSEIGFVFAAVGSAIGLGNIWKFPYIAGVHGGGAFVLVYLGCILVVGLPLMVAEVSLGKRAGKNLVGAMDALTTGRAGRLIGRLAGFLAVATSFLILSYYGVVAGYILHFLARATGALSLSEDPALEYTLLNASDFWSVLWVTCFFLLVVGVVAKGVHGGIELLCKWLMPALFALLLGLVGYAWATGSAGAAVRFLFWPEWKNLSAEGVLEALAHAFFTLSIGMGTMVVYGSYLKKKGSTSSGSVIRNSLLIVGLDTLIALVAGIVIFSAVFQGGAEPASGPGLLFETLPLLFADMPAGGLIEFSFFLLVVFAAWSSAVSMLEVVVAWLMDEQGFSRKRASLTAGAACYFVAIGCAYSQQLATGIEDSTGQVMLPLGGLLMVLAVGFCLGREDRESAFSPVGFGPRLARFWSLTLRTLTPAAVLAVLAYELGML